MSSNTSSHDETPDTGDRRRSRSTPGYLTFANTCGIIAVMLSGVLVFYYCLIGTGHLPAPIAGIAAIWVTAIIMLGMVKISVWAADSAANRVLLIVEQRFTLLIKIVDRVSADALQQAHESGQWKGIATTYRQEQAADTTNVVNGGFGRRGNNAN